MQNRKGSERDSGAIEKLQLGYQKNQYYQGECMRMTQKRFMLDDAGELIDLNNHKFIDYGEECCNLLNEQHETIERLKQNIDELLSVDIEEELLKENEQLKSELEPIRKICKKYRIPIKDLPEILEEYIAYDNDDDW